MKKTTITLRELEDLAKNLSNSHLAYFIQTAIEMDKIYVFNLSHKSFDKAHSACMNGKSIQINVKG